MKEQDMIDMVSDLAKNVARATAEKESMEGITFHEDGTGVATARCECGSRSWELKGVWEGNRCRVTAECRACNKKYLVAYACPAGPDRPVCGYFPEEVGADGGSEQD